MEDPTTLGGVLVLLAVAVLKWARGESVLRRLDMRLDAVERKLAWLNQEVAALGHGRGRRRRPPFSR